jgi:DNA processing protein
MAEPDSDDRRARITLAAISEPADTITGTLIAKLGAAATVDLITSEAPFPSTVDRAEGGLWRRRLAPRLEPDHVDRIRETMERRHLRMLTPQDLEWPAELQQLGIMAPIALWASGEVGRLAGATSTRITIVGARAATSYGEHVAMEISSELATQGRVVVSGGAYGIDGAAHRAATLARPGATVAVLATGLHNFYPAGHQQLFERIHDDGGLILSELPPGAAPTRWRYLQRDRLLAVLSGATAVVEAGYRSGSLSIAGQAHALGRPVGAVPGPVTSAASAGCHRLLQEGIATLVTDARDATDLLESTNAARNERVLAFPTFGRSARRLDHDITR